MTANDEVPQASPGSWVTIDWEPNGLSTISFPVDLVEHYDVEPLVRPEDLTIAPLSIALYTDSTQPLADFGEPREVTSFGYARREVSWSSGVVDSWSAHTAHDCPDCEAMAAALTIPPGSLAVDLAAESCTRDDDFGTEECDCSGCAERRADVEDREARWLEILSRETEVAESPWAAAVNVFGASPPDVASMSL